ncbi:MAG: methionyl-tRNA formyltransferase [Planctomycetota bacterium]|nr:MAG: methionyl-tRNA formyltransferase [Planctomycetota bacterium]
MPAARNASTDSSSMKVTLLASAEFALPTVRTLVELGHELTVGTQPARPAGRGRGLRATPVGRFAAELGLGVEELDDVNSPEGLAWMGATAPDLVAVVAFGQKLGPAVRAVAPWGCLNIHPSLLPRWRGAAPVQAAVLAGDTTTGVCVIDVVERMDAGDVLASRSTPVGRKTAGELLDELAAAGAVLLGQVLDGLAADEVRRTAQDESAVTRARKLSADDGRIRWEHSGAEVDCRVRGVTPRPGAFALLGEERLRILAGEPLPCPRGFLPGEVIEATDEGISVACGKDAYRITKLQRPGGKPLLADAFLRGHELPAGTRLGP